MKSKSWIGIGVILIIIIIGIKLYANKKIINKLSSSQTENSVEIRIPVVTDTVKLISLNDNLNKTGNISPEKEAILYAVSSGNIEQIYFDLGTNVKQGQLLAVIDTRKLNIDLQNSVASEQKLKSELQTYSELLAGKAATQEKVNQLKLDYNNAKNQTALIRKQINDNRIVAPISGIISEKTVEKGVFVNTGGKVGNIVALNKVKVQVYLTENEVYTIKMNDAVTITTDVYPDKTFIGKINYISSQADETHSYLVEILFENPKNTPLRSGTFVKATFSNTQNIPVLVMPREALIENAQEPSVYIIQNNKAVVRKVRLGKESGDFVEVLSGLKEGVIVVTSGQINLKDQSLVSVTNKNN